MCLGDLVLARFDLGVDELFHVTAVHTDDMVMMRALVEFEDRHAVLEMMARDQACGLELRQHPIHRGQPDILGRANQALVDLFGGQVARGAALENFQYFQARQRDFESDLAEIFPFHTGA